MSDYKKMIKKLMARPGDKVKENPKTRSSNRARKKAKAVSKSFRNAGKPGYKSGS